MTRRNIATYNDLSTADRLGRVVTQIDAGYGQGVVYVKDIDGNLITSAHLEEEILTDGSKVYNVILNTDKA